MYRASPSSALTFGESVGSNSDDRERTGKEDRKRVVNIEDVLRTRLCDLLGIKYPVVQAGMGYLARAELVSAVSNAGGLGVVGATFLPPDEVRQMIREVKDRTDKPYAVNIAFARVPKSQDTKVREYTDEVKEILDIIFEEQVPILSAALGNPAQAVPQAHALGMKVIANVGNVRNAVRVADGGVDIIVAQGHEAGGHTGKIATMVLVPLVTDAVEVPVLAAGGIADGRGLVAALALGACGVWMGTRFVVTKEAFAHINYKNKIIEVNEEGTVITRCYTGKTLRAIKNRLTEEWEGRESEILPFPRQMTKVGEGVHFAARAEGNTDIGSMPAGQISGMIKKIKSARDVVEDIMAEAREVLGRFECCSVDN